MKNISEKEAWGEEEHALTFDFMSDEPPLLLKYHYESFGEGQFLEKWRPDDKSNKLYEIGCATGELYRYIKNYRKDLVYAGFDVSKPAIKRAIEKYPEANFNIINNDLNNYMDKFGLPNGIWCRDVILHQKNPYSMLNQLIDLSKEALFIRLRTRDLGATELDINLSRQLHWNKSWVPYIVLNINELIDELKRREDIRSVEIKRSYNVLGGFNSRILPEELYFKESGTAETALFIKKSLSNNKDMKVTFCDSPTLDGRDYSIYRRLFYAMYRRLYKFIKY